MINPREFLRRLVKFMIMFLVMMLSLYNTEKLNLEEMLVIASTVTIIYCILDTMSPSIEIKKEN